MSVLEFKSILNNFEKEFPKCAEGFHSFCEKNNVNPKSLFDLEVSLEELVLNSFSYGNPKGPVTIVACIQDGQIKVSVHDFAPPFNLLRQAPELPEGDIEDRSGGGMGIHLVKNLSDRIEYSGSQQGNQVTFFKTIRSNIP